MKIIAILAVLGIVSLFQLCRADTTMDAKSEFAQYGNDENEVVLICRDTLYFEDHEINLDNLVDGEEANGGVTVRADKFYFSTAKQTGVFEYSLNIYSSDLLGENIDLIFTRGGYVTKPWTITAGDVFYIEHHPDTPFNHSSTIIDSYNLQNGEYCTVSSGEGKILSDFNAEKEIGKYDFRIINSDDGTRGFEITDKTNEVTRLVNDDLLSEMGYIDSMKKFGYWAERADWCNGHVLLTYGLSAGDGWSNTYLVFEYNFDSDTLEYILIAFPYEKLYVDLFYIAK